jgi:hypothetical protein
MVRVSFYGNEALYGKPMEISKRRANGEMNTESQ